MARVTVEDCFKNIKNRFELVLITVQRARDIHSGVPITLERDNDKDIVIALREIAADSISIKSMKKRILSRNMSSDPSQENDLHDAHDSVLEEKQMLDEIDHTNQTSEKSTDIDEYYTNIDLNSVFQKKIEK